MARCAPPAATWFGEGVTPAATEAASNRVRRFGPAPRIGLQAFQCDPLQSGIDFGADQRWNRGPILGAAFIGRQAVKRLLAGRRFVQHHPHGV